MHRKRPEPNLDLDELARAVVEAGLEVHRVLGPGFVESIYEQALGVELRLRGIPFVRQAPVATTYKGVELGQARLDLLVGNQLIVELKAVPTLLPIHSAQVLSYLKASGCPLALLINFNERMLRQGIVRLIRTSDAEVQP